MADNVFDLSILDSGVPEHAVALARRGPDLAVAKIPLGQKLQDLLAFRDRIDASVRGGGNRPKRDELTKYGEDLFNFVIRDRILPLYYRIPPSHVRVHILSDHPDLQGLPLEYLQEPNALPGPSRHSSVIRVVPTIGVEHQRPQNGASEIRILFVSSDPQGTGPVNWPGVKAKLEQTFTIAMSSDLQKKVVFEAVEGADRQQLLEAVAKRTFDVFHFMGHGQVANGVGQIVLTDPNTNGPDLVSATEFAQMLSGAGLKLVILSACNTSKQNSKDDFAGVAQALIQSKVPAVVANQLPIPNTSVATFVGAFYEFLLRKGDVDQAMNEGRIALAMELALDTNKDEAIVEWGIPTLYRHLDTPMLYAP